MTMDHFHARAKRPKVPRRTARSAKPAAAAATLFGAAERLDARIVALGWASSRTAAQRLIAAGCIWVEDQPCTKPSRLVSPETRLTLRAAATSPFVSRAGDKLAHALATLGWSVAGAVTLDVGQSTGGFTDCLLQQGVRRVVGIDVGHGQLSPKLRAQAQIFSPGQQPDAAEVAQWPILLWEGVNARTLDPALLGAAYPERGFDLIVGDLSFISALLVWPAILPLASRHGRLLWLVKPQFELGQAALDKHGVVRDLPRWEPLLRQRVAAMLSTLGWEMVAWFPSALTGGGVGHHPGNQEFFVAALRHLPQEKEDDDGTLS